MSFSGFITLFFVLLVTLFQPTRAIAQRNEPSDKFLQAYMMGRDAEDLEKQGKLEPALEKFRTAGKLLDDLKLNNPDWQPVVVDFRAKRFRESIMRLQNRLGVQDAVETPAPDYNAVPNDDSAIEGALPDNQGYPEPSIQTTPAPSTSYYGSDPLEEIRNRMQRMEQELAEAKARERQSQADRIQLAREKEALQKLVQDKTQELDRLRLSEAELRSNQENLTVQLKSATEAAENAIILEEQARRLEEELLKARAEREAADEEAEAITTRLTEVHQKNTILSTARATAEQERDDAKNELVKAQTLRETAEKERDAVREELSKAQASQKELERLATENKTLSDKLADAENKIKELNARPTLQEVSAIREQVQQIQSELAATQEENESFQNTITELRSQLADANSALENAKLGTSTQEPDPQLVEENRLLKDILTRELDNQVRRDQAKKLILEELSHLEGNTTKVLENLNFLAQPVYKLSDKELALLRPTDPSISSENSNTGVSISIAVPKDPENNTDGKNEPPLPTDQTKTNTPNIELDNTPPVPAELEPVAREAREHFNRKEYRDAEKLYEQILAKEPDNIYALSNLGVTRFRAGKLKAAELTFEKAVALNPGDSFSYGTLGIVYYRQARYDDAVNVLTKAISLDPKNAIAHNYLGITASQKGWQEAAEKELQTAIALNPNYADAHFNIAVIYATSEPPSKELAKKHYHKALELGAEKDTSLEALLQ